MTTLHDDISLLEVWFAGSPASVPESLVDPLHERLADAVWCWQKKCGLKGGHVHASNLDVAVLLRHVARRLREIRGLSPLWLSTEWDLGDALASVNLDIDSVESGQRAIRSRPWRPEWLHCGEDMPDVDAAALAGLPNTKRAGFLLHPESLVADEFFRVATGFDSYRSLGQMVAARTAKSLSPGATLIAQLPTGSGKTDIAMSAVHEECNNGGIALIVVPTVALALDLERRVRETLEKVWNYGRGARNASFAWHACTSTAVRDDIVDRITSGEQRIIITSPESLMMSSVGTAVGDMASAGQLSWMIVDEAHIIKQWGESFRAEFLELGGFAEDLRRRATANAKVPCRTLLLSATLTDEHIGDLTHQFAGSGTVRLVAANELRREPEVWSSGELSTQDRTKRVVEALCHLPRPAIVYASIPPEANRLVETIRSAGLTRVAVFSGETAGDERAEVLERFRLKGEDGSGLDIVVATSAFGLGVDYDQVRTVIHACIPETVDRWYQEVGRSGRDGFASVAVLLPTAEDRDVALGMGVKHLKADTFADRWAKLQRTAEVVPNGGVFNVAINLDTTSGTARAGSYNRRWNHQVLRGLEEMGRLRMRRMSFGEVQDAGLPSAVDDVPTDWRVVTLFPVKLGEAALDEVWEQWRDLQLASEEKRWNDTKELAAATTKHCRLLREVFAPGRVVQKQHPNAQLTFGVTEGCGRCPGCRYAKVRPLHRRLPSPSVAWCTDHAAHRSPSVAPGLHVVIADSADETEVIAFHLRHGFEFVVASESVGVQAGILFRDETPQHPWATPGCDDLVLTGGSGWPTSFVDRAHEYPSCAHVVVVRNANELPVGSPPPVSWPAYRIMNGIK